MNQTLTHKPPGTVLLDDFIKPLKLSIPTLAKTLLIPPNRLYAILNDDRDITPDTAQRLGKYFGTGPEVWLMLQMKHSLNKHASTWKEVEYKIPTLKENNRL